MKSDKDRPFLKAAFWARSFSFSSIRIKRVLSWVMGFRFSGMAQVYTIASTIVYICLSLYLYQRKGPRPGPFFLLVR
jgi:hypothetical protein